MLLLEFMKCEHFTSVDFFKDIGFFPGVHFISK